MKRRWYCSLAVATNARKGRGHWSDVGNQRQFFDQIGKELGISQPSDWYRVSRQRVTELGGRTLFHQYVSLSDALKAVYPEHNWEDNLFENRPKVPHKHWKRKSNLFAAIDRAEKALGIQQPEDWYTVALTDLRALGFPYNVDKMRLSELLSEKYPAHKWEKVFLLKSKYSQQRRLERSIAQLFPGENVIRNARKEAGLVNPETGIYMELDIWIPSLNLAFEYQEKHHYASAGYAFKPLEVYQSRDATKRKLAEVNNITLIIVPYWWDGQKESLAATIIKHRPELLLGVTQEAEPIPEDMPAHLHKPAPQIADIGEPTTACFLTQSPVDPSKWWIFEKYDGVRGFWNPSKQAFYSRHGNRFDIPKHVIDTMPQDTFLDGELWFGRENFQEAMKIANRVKESDIDWPRFKYMVFDIPTHKGTYQERYTALVEKLRDHLDRRYLEVAPKEECKDMPHLETRFQDILDQGGEGIILRDPSAPYQPGRSPGFLKHKKYRDAEARIVNSVGEHQWECELPNGVKFTAAAGSAEFSKRYQPKPGDIVSFKHRGFLLTSKRPKLPTLHRLRPDLTWETVVQSWKERKPSIGEPLIRKKRRENKPKGYWRKRENRRQYLCKFAEAKEFDPLVPENWRDISAHQIALKAGGLLTYFGGNLHRALRDSFPELNWDQNDASTRRDKKDYWKDPTVCRRFFDEYAKERAFDPLDPDNWYNINLQFLRLRQGGAKVTNSNGGFRAALRKAYPEVDFALFPVPPKGKNASSMNEEV